MASQTAKLCYCYCYTHQLQSNHYTDVTTTHGAINSDTTFLIPHTL